MATPACVTCKASLLWYDGGARQGGKPLETYGEEGRIGLGTVGYGSFGKDSVTAVVERLSHRFLSRAGAFYHCCFADPGRGLVIRFTVDVHCLRGGLRCENHRQ